MCNPFVKSAGGKRKLLPEITAAMPETFNMFYEPFVGGGALALHLLSQGHSGFLSDANRELIYAYQTVRDNPQALIALLGEMKNTEEEYYRIREVDRSDFVNRLTVIERGARYIYLNKNGYNGLWRVNKQGQCNVSWGKKEDPLNHLDTNAIHQASAVLSNADINYCGFGLSLIGVRAGDFVYLDPPYDPVKDDSFTGYAGDFGDRQQIELSILFRDCIERGGKPLMSNSDTPFIRQLYREFEIIEVMAARSINSDKDGRGKVKELLIKGY